jgi:dTDP-glucose 4,6-dehydratase
MPAPLIKAALTTLDALGLPLMYPEQFRIADADILLDTSETRRVLGWEPNDEDTGSMIAAYRAFCGAVGGSPETHAAGADGPKYQ